MSGVAAAGTDSESPRIPHALRAGSHLYCQLYSCHPEIASPRFPASISRTPFACGSRSLLRELSRATAAGPMRGCSINAEQVLLECSRCALLMPTLARKSANPGHMSPKFLRCAGCMDCASRRGRILREGGARKQRLLASEKSRPATRSSAALVRLGDAQEAPSNRRLRAAWLARVRPRWQLTSGRGSSHTLNSWPRARLSPLPYTIAAAAATAALVAAATAAAVTAGGPLLLPRTRKCEIGIGTGSFSDGGYTVSLMCKRKM